MTPLGRPKLDGFEFLDYLGGGTFGQVWKALDLKMKVLRAIKVLDKERFRECNARRLLAEAQTMAQLPKHRNRVAVHHFKEGVTNCFLIMDFVSGGALSRRTSPGQPLPWGQATRYAAGVADALKDVHARGLLHRDIKPDNILWDPDLDEAVLGDFGIAVSVELAARGGGTRGYIAPEVYQGVASPKSDVYSLAATLLHLVTSERPKENARLDDYAHWASLPEELRQVLQSGLEPDPDRRVDLPTFLALLREARWKALTDRMLADLPSSSGTVRLQAAVAVAEADRPSAFRPLLQNGRPVPARTGDFVKIEAQADADGYLTVLILESSGQLEVGLPCPTEPHNHFQAGQRCNLIFRLSPPVGTERILIHWSAQEVQRTPSQWLQWVERTGHTTENPDSGAPEVRVRGMDLLRVKKGPAPEGQRRILVIPVPHVVAC
jgi:serine/threonine-protein kinase